VSKNLPISRFGWDKGCLIASFNKNIFTKGPLVFIIQIFLMLNFLCGNKVLLDTCKKHSNFHFFSFSYLSKITFCLKSTSPLQHVNVMQCIYCLKKGCNL
jgi:hypothetical protein